MRKIENFVASTRKANSGTLDYCLWVSDEGALYVQIVFNHTDTKKPGTHSNLLFPVSKYACLENTDKTFKKIHGINPSTLLEEVSNDNNDAGFIKAIIGSLLPQQAK